MPRNINNQATAMTQKAWADTKGIAIYSERILRIAKINEISQTIFFGAFNLINLSLKNYLVNNYNKKKKMSRVPKIQKYQTVIRTAIRRGL